MAISNHERVGKAMELLKDGLAPFVNGSMFPPRDGANKAVLLGIVMYLIAFIPVGSKPDPDLFLQLFDLLTERRLRDVEPLGGATEM